jgi:hypothetical protein
MDRFLATHFQVGSLEDESSNVYKQNLPEYSNVLGNF